MEIIPFQPMTTPRSPPIVIAMNGKAAANLWRIRDVVQGAITKNTPIRVTPRPAAQRIKEKKCRSSWSIDYRFSRYTVVFPDVTSAFTDDSWGTTNSILRCSGSKSR